MLLYLPEQTIRGGNVPVVYLHNRNNNSQLDTLKCMNAKTNINKSACLYNTLHTAVQSVDSAEIRVHTPLHPSTWYLQEPLNGRLLAAGTLSA